jgi:hypothetical protein
MFADWIYNNPTWLWGPVLVAAAVAVSCLGLLLFDRVCKPQGRAESSDAYAAVFGVTGTVYAVLIGFVAIAAWQAFSEGDKIVQEESSHLTGIYRDVAGLEPQDVELVRGLLREYADHVATKEWAAQMAGKAVDHGPGRQILGRLHDATLGLDHGGRAQALVQAEVLRALNDLYKARRARHIAAAPDSGVPSVVWAIIAIGTSLTIFACYLLAVSSLRLHLLLVAIVSASIVLVIVMVLALDRPFRGELCVSKEPFELAIGSMQPPGERAKK